jgi:hypothetical protein
VGAFQSLRGRGIGGVSYAKRTRRRMGLAQGPRGKKFILPHATLVISGQYVVPLTRKLTGHDRGATKVPRINLLAEDDIGRTSGALFVHGQMVMAKNECLGTDSTAIR